MGITEDLGKGIARFTRNWSKLMSKELKNNARSMASEMADYRTDAIPKMNEEVAVKSLNPKLFRTKEFQKLSQELKDRLKHSPGGVADWFNETLGGIFEGFYDLLIGIIVPSKIEGFTDAKEAAGYLTFLCIDAVVLIAVLDIVATAASLTLVRNLAQIGRLFVATFGLDRYIGAVIAPALNAGLVPQLRHGFNEQFQAEIPGSTDLVRMELREVFRPEYRDELLTPGTTSIFKDAMRKRGFNDYWIDSFWAAHWNLPSLGNLDEMLHRRIITEDEWETMVRRNDYLPAWIPMRKKIIYSPYTRVDTRRMWELGVLNDTEIYNNYRDIGYDDEHAKRMTLWTKLYVSSVELRARYSKGWITGDQVLEEVIKLGLPEARAKIWVQKIITNNSETRTENERDLTKSEIVKGVKDGFLTIDEGIELLMDMGYDESEAEYIIAINVESLTGSPKVYTEFKDLVNKRRKAQGMGLIDIPKELREIDERLKNAMDELDALTEKERTGKTGQELEKKIKTLKAQHDEIYKASQGIGKTGKGPSPPSS